MKRQQFGKQLGHMKIFTDCFGGMYHRGRDLVETSSGIQVLVDTIFFFTLFLPKWPGGGSATLHQPNTSYSLEDQTCLIHQPQPAPLKGDCIWKAALAGRSALQKQLLLWRSSPSHQPMQQLWPNLSANLNNIDPTHQHTIANTGQT